MTERSVPKLTKWPFYLCDLLLLLLAVWIVYHYPNPLGSWPLFFLVLSVVAGGWFGVAPFLAEYRRCSKCRLCKEGLSLSKARLEAPRPFETPLRQAQRLLSMSGVWRRAVHFPSSLILRRD